MNLEGSTALRALHVGCPMWAQRAWVGRYLPADTVPGQELVAYSRLLDAVEGNTTFYASPPALTVRKWATQARPGFRFVFKAPRQITHEARLRHVEAPLAAFVDLLAPLGDLVGGITLQLPPSFGPGDLEALDAVLGTAPGEWPWSVEVRHPQFFGGPGLLALHRLLDHHGAERVVLDTDALFHRTPFTEAGREEWRTKPRVPLLAEALTASPIVRFIGSDHAEITEAGLTRWAEPIARWIEEGRTPTFFVHTPDNTDSPQLARGFHGQVAGLVAGLAPLPEPLPVASPDQPTLF